jgi:hypothetical protein
VTELTTSHIASPVTLYGDTVGYNEVRIFGTLERCNPSRDYNRQYQ